MGLDGVLVVMATEARFRITITDQEAEALRVVEDLHRGFLETTSSRGAAGANFGSGSRGLAAA